MGRKSRKHVRSRRKGLNCYVTFRMACADLADHVRRSSVVVLAADNDPIRYRLNQLCVESKTPTGQPPAVCSNYA
jgi:molybdopterin/thiamine biosynthesis adenylyltransferase